MFYRWDAPDGRSVIFQGPVVEKLRGRVIEAFLSLPRRGAETGGLLLGRVRSASPLIVRIEGFEEIPCQHRFGPSYVLDESDRDGLVDALARARSADEPAVVGFYRSFTGRDMALEDGDADLMRAHLPSESSVFLLLKPTAADACDASFTFWERGELGPESPYPVFQFRSSAMVQQDEIENVVDDAVAEDQRQEPELGAGSKNSGADPEKLLPAAPVAITAKVEERQRFQEVNADAAVGEARAPEPVQSAAAGADPEKRRSAPLPPPHPRRLLEDSIEIRKPRIPRRRIWAALAASVAVSVGAAFVYELWSLAREPRWSQLRLDAKQTPAGIDLVWDRTAGAVDEAQRGVLSIDDNSGHHEIELTPAQIHAGQYTYPAEHDDVLFRLTLYGGGIQASGDSLRVMNARPAGGAVEPAAATAKAAVPAPAKAAQPEAGETSPPAGGDASQRAAMAPVVLREVQPTVPAGIRSRIRERIIIPVDVQVSAAGRVTSAVPQRDGDTLHRYLAGLAAAAARSWRFSPARAKNGQATAGVKTIYFIFAPNT